MTDLKAMAEKIFFSLDTHPTYMSKEDIIHVIESALRQVHDEAIEKVITEFGFQGWWDEVPTVEEIRALKLGKAGGGEDE